MTDNNPDGAPFADASENQMQEGVVGGRWLPIETAPKDGTLLLLGGSGWVDVGSWRESLNGEKDEGWTCEWVKSWGYEEYAYCKPTHWQPRPEPPSAVRGSVNS